MRPSGGGTPYRCTTSGGAAPSIRHAARGFAATNGCCAATACSSGVHHRATCRSPSPATGRAIALARSVVTSGCRGGTATVAVATRVVVVLDVSASSGTHPLVGVPTRAAASYAVTVRRALAVRCARTSGNRGGSAAGRPSYSVGATSAARHAAIYQRSSCGLGTSAEDRATTTCHASATAGCTAAARPTGIAGDVDTACNTASGCIATECDRTADADSSTDSRRPAGWRLDLRGPTTGWGYRVSAIARGASAWGGVPRGEDAARCKKRSCQCHETEDSWRRQMWKNHLVSELTFARAPSKGRQSRNLELRGANRW